MLALLAVAVLAAHAALLFSNSVDDAYITLRYAQNLANGHGLVFNPGEHVEGFTNLGLVLLEAGLFRLGADAERVLDGVAIFGILCGIATVLAAGAIARWLSPGRRGAGAAAVLLLAIHPSFALACVNRLETSPYTAALTLGALVLLRNDGRRPWSSALAFGAATLLRPDGLLFAGLAGLWGLHRTWCSTPRERALPATTRWGLGYGATLALFVLPVATLKLLYFGALLPTTFTAKVATDLSESFASGGAYLAEYFLIHGGGLALAGAVAAVVWRGRGSLFLLGSAGIYLVYVASVGGDWIPRFRFAIPVVGLVAALADLAITRGVLDAGLTARRRSGAALALVLLAAPSVRPFAAEIPVVNSIANGNVLQIEVAAKLGRWLEESTAPDAVIASYDVGALGFHAHRRIIDTGGLTDPVIARLISSGPGVRAGHLLFPGPESSSRIAEEVLSRAPERIVLLAKGELQRLLPGRRDRVRGPLGFAYPQDGAIFQHPDFAKHYVYVCDQPDRSGWSYAIFARDDAPPEGPPERRYCVVGR